MNLTAHINRISISRALLVAVLLSIFPVITGSSPTANAANLSTTQAATACASAVTDSSTAKLDVRIDGNYCVLSFLSGSNTWMPPSGVTQIEYLVVAGGGGGGGNRGGGGGAGGFVTSTDTVTSQISISVGNGGAGGVNSSKGTNGSDSTLSFTGKTVTAVGGGAGGAPFVGSNVASANSGGSGGGSGTFASSGTANTDIGSPGGSGTASQGYAGGSTAGKAGNDGTDSSYSYKGTCTNTWDAIRNSAGGGGAGGKGISGRGGSISNPATTLTCVTAVTPDGGPGRASSITGSSRIYAGGGGGAAGRFNKNDTENNYYYTAGPGSGGSGIGGAGSPIIGTVGGAGAPNTGSGGGGGGNSWTTSTDKGACGAVDNDEACDGGAGGSGIVIIRFQKYLDNASECLTGVENIGSSVFSYTTFAGDCILTFKSSAQNATGLNSWTVPEGITNARFLIVGGGGGGGNDLGGGGGGGQVVDTASVQVIPSSKISITIGKGGGNGGGVYASTYRYATSGVNGESSTVRSSNLNLLAYGGGGAWGRDQVLGILNYPSWNGVTWTQGGYGLGHTYLTGHAIGFWTTDGGQSVYTDSSNTTANAGGGGGAGGVGSNAAANSSEGGGNGGIGITTDITGFSQCLGGGGGGGATYDSSRSRPYAIGIGKCGGGNGLNSDISTGQDATPNTGAGGGGDHDCSICTNGGQGAAGIVIIRYTLKTSNKSSQNLNMACHGFSSATSPSEAETAGYFGKQFTTDTGTTEFAFPTSTGSDTYVYQDWGGSAPVGCSSSSDYYTVYISGYVKAPSSTQSSTVWFATNTDDGGKLNIDGLNLVNDTRIRGFDVGIDTATVAITMAPNSWHYIQLWMHENQGAAAIALYWQTNSTPQANSWNLVPRTNISRTVPRTLTFKTPSLDSSILTASVDTNTVVVYGGPNDSSTVKSTGGTFAFYDSGTAISGCSSIVAVRGQANCDLGSLPTAGVKKYYKIVFTPETSTASSDIQHNVYAPTLWSEIVTLGKVKNASLKIGQYDAFPGISTYPLNVYADGTIYGALTRTLTDTGTAGCALDATRFFLTATKVGTCTVAVNAAGDALHYSETTTAVIYWIQFRNNFATQVATVPTQIALSGEVQIIKHSYDTLTVTSFKNADGSSAITSATVNQTIRIYGTGFLGSDTYGVVHLGGGNDLYWSYSEFSVNTSDASANYIQLTIPAGTTSDKVAVEFTNKGVVYSTDVLTITS